MLREIFNVIEDKRDRTPLEFNYGGKLYKVKHGNAIYLDPESLMYKYEIQVGRKKYYAYMEKTDCKTYWYIDDKSGGMIKQYQKPFFC